MPGTTRGTVGGPPRLWPRAGPDIRASRRIRGLPELARRAPALGLGAHGGEPARPRRVDFAPGDQLLLCTDGVTEARDTQHQRRPRAASNPVAGISRPPG
ncbi:serine/threonine-protein phosphatase [Streptomyces sp. NBC_01378]|uniref:SpoIIE family protein phosphatase n=1 Tax=Streptomyces sp. NBC_01378 TaxID=2903844 RepID=UPI0032563B01